MSTPQVVNPYAASPGMPPIVTVRAIALTGSFQLMTGAGQVIAVTAACRSTTVPATFQLCDSNSANTLQIVAIGVVPGGGFSVGPGLPGISFMIGLYLYHLSGEADITVTYIPLLQPLE